MEQSASAASKLPGGLPVVDGFRQRGLATTRLEAFLDAGFAFALTLLVISVGEVPASLRDLLAALGHLPAFGASFAQIAMFWCAHNRWSRRFGLDDGRSTVLSLLLLFVVLVFVYPLRIVFECAFAFVSGGGLPAAFELRRAGDMQWLFIVYALGFTSMSLLIAALNRHALSRADELGLDGGERLGTREEIGGFAILAGTGVLSLLCACVLLCFPPSQGWLVGLPGWCYSALAVVLPLYHGRMARERGPGG